MSDIHAALFGGTPSRANAPSLRRGVAWWGGIAGTGRCDCCGKTAPVCKGYNGGAHLPDRFCVPCTADGHKGCREPSDG